MKTLKKEDSLTCDVLKNGDSCVRKSDTPFTSLFADQTLEQEIKKLKGIGGITGLAKHDEILDRLLLTARGSAQYIEDFQDHYTRTSGTKETSKNHHQLYGEIAMSLLYIMLL